jgi:hypothetical protein
MGVCRVSLRSNRRLNLFERSNQMSETNIPPATPTPAPPTLLEELETAGHEALSAAKHLALKLVGLCATANVTLHTLEQTYPGVQTLIEEAVAGAALRGMPVEPIETLFQAGLALAKQFAGSLVAPPPASATAGAGT